MASKTLIMYEDHEEERMLTTLTGSVQEETLYAEFACNDGSSKSFDTIELAVHVDDIIKIRDFCNKLISKIGPAGVYNAEGIYVGERAD